MCFSSGKRGTKQRVGVVDISEIVSRIAPKVRTSLVTSHAQPVNGFCLRCCCCVVIVKHGRPEAAEPTLQQWIGDGVPCTPDVQAVKPKKKSLRWAAPLSACMCSFLCDVTVG